MSRQARLGLVVLAGIVAFIGALFILANRTYLLSDTFTVVAEFDRVGGLLPGATVFYNGISVGRVETVQLPAAPGQPITVVMRVRSDARRLVRTDSRALIQTDGLVGSVVVALTGGSASRPVVPENGQIEGVNPLDLSQFSSKALESVARLDSVTITLTSIMQDVRSGEGTLGQFLYDDRLYEESVATTAQARQSLQAVLGRADALVAVAEEASLGVNAIIAQVQNGDGALSRILREDSIYTALLTAGNEFSTISEDLRGITDRFETAAGWASLGAFRFSENMEALKHNFLFKSYFEERGYLEMAPFEIRERALAETYQELQEYERRLYRERAELERIRAEIEARAPGTLPAATPAGGSPGSPTGDASGGG